VKRFVFIAFAFMALVGTCVADSITHVTIFGSGDAGALGSATTLNFVVRPPFTYGDDAAGTLTGCFYSCLPGAVVQVSISPSTCCGPPDASIQALSAPFTTPSIAAGDKLTLILPVTWSGWFNPCDGIPPCVANQQSQGLDPNQLFASGYGTVAITLFGLQTGLPNVIITDIAQNAWNLTPVPEPASVVLVATGLITVLWKRRKRLSCSSYFSSQKCHF
jgi:hypothetical protein